jgi:hypothetical protein
MVPEGIKDQTNQGYKNIFISVRSTIMFDLSKSFFLWMKKILKIVFCIFHIVKYGVNIWCKKKLPKSKLFKLVNVRLIDDILTCFLFMVNIYNYNIFFYFCLTIFS